jgi:tetratricopeptide (TPR) repeat protein
MKRIVLVSLIALTMIGLFIANQTHLLADSERTAESPEVALEAMRTANQLYEAGQYAQAAQAYQQLANQGFANGALFYNLGNAQFKQGNLGQAILNYRRAQQYTPRDPDVAANLAIARGLAADQGEAVAGGGMLSRIGRAVRSRLSLDEVAMVALGSWIGFVLSLLLWGSAKRGGVWQKRVGAVSAVLAVVLAVSVLGLGSSLYLESRSSDGVIVAPEVAVTSGPGSQYGSEFTLHSGAEVSLVEAQGNWVRLALPGSELEGWIPASAIETVDG